MITAPEFIAKWGPGGSAAHLNEEQGAQSHFLDLCELLGVPKPGSPGLADEYLFERQSLVLGEARGYADVFYRDHFAWENKAPGKNLDAALRQLQQYSLNLSNPPLLVVCDRLTIRVHTQFNGHPSETHTVRIDQLDQPAQRDLLRRLWTAPDSFRPRQTNRDITEEAARSFATLAEQLRGRGHHPDVVAHFLTQCLFCFFAEDVGLLPGRMFERLVGNRQITSDRLTAGLAQLFSTMQSGGLYGPDDIPWFNGGLFQRIDVPQLEILDITELRNAASLNWSAIDVSIFGTLFERGLDPAKRSQLGAHYTDPATIARIVEPVVTRPLLQQWELVAHDLQALTARIKRHGDASYRKAHARFIDWLESLRAYRILDPACGSGNFLFMGLKALKDIELFTLSAAADLGLDREQDLVTGPHNMLGIELNEYAAELARVSLWIGEIQWRMAHGYPPKTNPVLEPLEQIECRDALLQWLPADRPVQDAAQASGTDPDVAQPNPGADPDPGPQGPRAVEAPWPKADVVIGNPPFIGDKKMRRELGDAYVDALRKTFQGRVPGGADFVCYWFEKSRAALVTHGLVAAGLVTTNSIRGGANRKVLDAIVRDSRIYDAWSDEPWVNDGAAVRVSLVAFGNVAPPIHLDGQQVDLIQSSLDEGSAGNADLTSVKRLSTNGGASFQGPVLVGDFEIRYATAKQWLWTPNPHGRPNADVVRPLMNGKDITSRSRGVWVVDFNAMTESDASLFEKPFEYVRQYVKPFRDKNRDESRKKRWWLHGRLGTDWRTATRSVDRYVATSQVSKHRTWTWQSGVVWPHQTVIAIARADDTTFGILHSRFHELWSLRMGTSLEDRPRYTPTTCFETFPFPAGLTPADTAHQRTEALPGGALIPAGLSDDSEPNRPPDHSQTAPAAIKIIETRAAASTIAEAAHRLDGLRQNWLNPPEWTQRVPEVVPLGMTASPYPDRIEPRPDLSEADAKALQKRTLTNLYNQRPAWLAQAHAQLDAAVAAAYGWADYTADMPDDEILRRLLALNLARAATAPPTPSARAVTSSAD
ncbi:class I SAM-dependent DNA methyltransferase [Ottowia flava]|uniref:site-specific DNA-methyltransferase (adenine-specific) n=1 Tax=Ottowia flava TaxID=2675430 RepID=A0ABW4KQL7_9BURK|nr:class I SAM-dependent DNA methyltransferase [Ottowia sp. GY511]